MQPIFKVFLILTTLITYVNHSSADTPPQPGLAETLSETLELKDLKFEQSFNQHVKEVKVEADRILLVPELPKNDSYEESKIPYTQLCASHKINKEKLSSLRAVRFSGTSYQPSVNSPKAIGDKTPITIGSNQIILYAVLPDLRDEKTKVFTARSVMGTTVVGPISKSHQLISNEIVKNSVVQASSETSVDTIVGKYTYYNVSMKVLAENEGFFTFDKDMAGIKIETLQYSAAEYSDDSYTMYDTALSKLSNETIETYYITEKNSEIIARKIDNSKAAEPKVMICWKTNNYSSVTSEAPMLIAPKVVLEYKK